MKLEISEKKINTGAVELLLKGELTINSVKTFCEKFKTLMKDFQSIEINMANVAKIDSAGFQILLSALKSCKNASLTKQGDEVIKLFSFYGNKI